MKNPLKRWSEYSGYMEQPMYAQAREEFGRLSAKLRRIKSGYEWARSRGDSDRIDQFQMQLDAIAAEQDRLLRHASIANSQAEDERVFPSASTPPVRPTQDKRGNMITSADPKPFFLSVDPKDGSMEAFDEIEAAVAHATDLVRDQDTERLIFVAVPRARVRMTVRVEPLDPPTMPAPGPVEPSKEATAWAGSQELALQSNGKDRSSNGRHSSKEEEPDHI